MIIKGKTNEKKGKKTQKERKTKKKTQNTRILFSVVKQKYLEKKPDCIRHYIYVFIIPIYKFKFLIWQSVLLFMMLLFLLMCFAFAHVRACACVSSIFFMFSILVTMFYCRRVFLFFQSSWWHYDLHRRLILMILALLESPLPWFHVNIFALAWTSYSRRSIPKGM